jgi:MSHA biogenesis protein MshI
VTQYINLYDDSLRPSKDLLTLDNVAIALAVTVVLLMGLAAFGMARSGEEMRSFKVAEAKLRQAQEQLTVVALQHASRKQDPELAQALELTRQQLAAKRDVLERLKGGRFGERNGFSTYFLALAGIELEGLWITAFDVNVAPAGQNLEVRGRMLNESLLPRYVQALGRQSVFAGREFAALNINRIEPKAEAAAGAALPAYVEFVLSGSVATGPVAGGPR